MRTNDGVLLFAPDIAFSDVDLYGPCLPAQLRRRFEGFYIEPAEECAKYGNAFAAGVLLVTCIDALAYLRYPLLRAEGNVKKRFVKLTGELQGFRGDGLAKAFYDVFRNGLVHEGRVKSGGEFCEGDATIKQMRNKIFVVSPIHLVAEVRAALESYITRLDDDERERTALGEFFFTVHFQREFQALAG